MSTNKSLLAVSAVALLATSTQALRFDALPGQFYTPVVKTPFKPIIRPSLYDEEEWTANAGISGGAGGRPSWNVGISHTWEEEQELQKFNLGKSLDKALDLAGKAKKIGLFDEEEWTVNGGISGGAGGRPSWNVGVSHSWEEEQEALQKIKLGQALKKAANVLVKANELGLLEEDADMDEVQKIKLGNVIKGAVKVVKVAGAVGLLEEDMDEVQKFHLGKALDKALDLAGKAKKIGLFEEEEELQKFNLGKSLDKALDLAGKAKKIGLFDEEEWTANAGISGGAGGRPQWQLGISHTWEEEELTAPKWTSQSFGGFRRPQADVFEEGSIQQKCGGTMEACGYGTPRKPFKFSTFDEELSQPQITTSLGFEQKITKWEHVNDALVKAATLLDTAKKIGLLEEFEFGADFGGDNHGNINWGVHVSHKFEDDEEQDEIMSQNDFKNILNTATDVLIKAKQLGLFDQETEELIMTPIRLYPMLFEDAIVENTPPATTTTTITTKKPFFTKTEFIRKLELFKKQFLQHKAAIKKRIQKYIQRKKAAAAAASKAPSTTTTTTTKPQSSFKTHVSEEFNLDSIRPSFLKRRVTPQ